MSQENKAAKQLVFENAKKKVKQLNQMLDYLYTSLHEPEKNGFSETDKDYIDYLKSAADHIYNNYLSEKNEIELTKNKIKGLYSILASVNQSLDIEDKDSLNENDEIFILMLQLLSNELAESIISEKLEKTKKEDILALRKANDKIRELELKKGEDIDLSQATSFAKLQHKKIETILSEQGFQGSVSISIHPYVMTIDLSFYPIRNVGFMKEYISSEEDAVKMLNDESNKNKKAVENFDLVKGRGEKAYYYASTERNVFKISQVLQDFNPSIQISKVSTRDMKDTEKYIEKMSFSINSNSFFLGGR